MSRKTLLQIAKESEGNISKKKSTEEEVQLALAWAKNEITITQAMTALGKGGSNVYIKLAQGLKTHIQSSIKK